MGKGNLLGRRHGYHSILVQHRNVNQFICHELFHKFLIRFQNEEKSRFSAENRKHIQSEIRKLYARTKQDGLTLIPLSVYFKRGRMKIEIGLAKGKKTYDKREDASRRVGTRFFSH